MKTWLLKRNKLLISGLILCAGIMVYATSLFLVLSKIEEIENAYAESESIVAKEERARAINAVANSHRLEIQALKDFFVAPGDELTFIEKIEQIGRASSTKFEIVSISQGKSETSATKEDINLRINIEGSWQDIMSFIKKMESMPFGVLVTNAEFDAKTPGHWTGSMELIVFRQKLK